MEIWQSRDQLPLLLNKLGLFGDGVEVGTLYGHFASHIRANWKGQMLYCVDRWKFIEGYDDSANMPQEEQDKIHDEAKERVEAAVASVKLPACLVRSDSVEAAKHFASLGFRFDFVYIDADHSYEGVKADLEAYWPLVKSGGIFAGHDFIADGFHRPGDPFVGYATKEECGPQYNDFGVRKAVNEWFAKNGLDELHLTDENDCYGWRSWLVRKPF